MKQKGQDIVEFALLLPLFMLLLYGMMYASFFFSDYMTISGIVRSAAREAAVVPQYDANGDMDPSTGLPPSNYDVIAKRYDKVLAETQMITHLYMPQGVTVKYTGENPTNGEPADAVHASVTMKLTDNVLLITAMRNRGMGFVLDGYEIDYYMHSEAEDGSSN